jgi:hypothetical protein
MATKKKTKTPKKNGRPEIYTIEKDTEICTRLGNGESLVVICKEEHMPNVSTIYNWLANEKYKEFLDRYTLARERQAETFIDQCSAIADSTDNDTITKIDKNGDEYEAVNHDHINRSRLRVDTRIKIAEKLLPSKYNSKLDLNVTGDIKINIVDNFK